VYEGTVKLHGTNLGIVFSEDHLSFRIQGRRTYIDPATAPHGISSYFKDFTPQDFFVDPSYMDQFRGKEFVLYGEFIGRGIQKGTALSTMDHRFVAIAVRCGKGPILDPPEVKPPLDSIDKISETLVLKSDLSNYKEFIQKAMRLTLAIDEECPWAKARGVVGHGEGIVWKPRGMFNSHLWLKTKGPSHKHKTRILDPERKERMNKRNEASWELYERTDGPTRVQQGFDLIQEECLMVGVTDIPKFLKWFMPDFLRECSSVVSEVSEETSVPEKDLRKGVCSFAAQEFKAIIQNKIEED